MKYISIPQIVDAEQYLGDPIRGVHFDRYVTIDSITNVPYVITIQEQKVSIMEGEWIIDEGDGKHFYPITDYLFKKKYKPYRKN